MSRYRLLSARRDHETIVGWDNPLQTFFVYVRDTTTTEEEDDRFVFEKGQRRQEIPTVTELARAVKPYALFPSSVQEALIKDYTERTRPTPLQEHMIAMGEQMIAEAERRMPPHTERDR